MDGCVGFLPHSNDTGFGATIVTESGFCELEIAFHASATDGGRVVFQMGSLGPPFPRLPLSTDGERVVFQMGSLGSPFPRLSLSPEQNGNEPVRRPVGSYFSQRNPA